MNDIDRFFLELDKETDTPLKIILTGAMAGMIMGNVRPSVDIDFEVKIDSKEKKEESVNSAIQTVSERLGIPVEYSDNIEGWGQISFLNYRDTAELYKQIGKIRVFVLSPECWSIGKISRYIELDQKDVAAIFKKKSIRFEKICDFWALALRSSPLSGRSREFRDHVINFFQEEGQNVWGKDFDPTEAIKRFKTKAGIPETKQ